MAHKKIILLIIGFVVATAILLVILFLYSNSSVSSGFRNFVGFKREPSEKLYDLSGTELPLDTYFDSVNGLVISGILKVVSLEESPFIVLETETSGSRKTVKITLPKDYPFLVLRLANGKYGQVEEWRGHILEDLKGNVKLDTQAIAHIQVDENEAQAIIRSLQAAREQKEIGEAVRLVLSD